MKYQRQFRQAAPTLFVGIISLAISLAAWHQSVISEDKTSALEYASLSNGQAKSLQAGIESYWDKLFDVRAFMNHSDIITRDEFEDFARLLIADHPAIMNIGWFPRIRRNERGAHELAAARDGIVNYHIRAVVSNESLPVAPEQDEYFPKFYSTEARTSRVYGLNLNDGRERQQTIAHIRDDNSLMTSPLITLHIGEGDRRGFWAAVPVYQRGMPHNTVDERRRNLRGYVQGVFQVGVMIDVILSSLDSPGQLYVFGPGASRSDPSIYFSSNLGNELRESRSQFELAPVVHKSFPIRFGDTEWTMVLTPDPLSLAHSNRAYSRTVLTSGLILAVALTVFVWAIRRSNGKLETSIGNLKIINDKYNRINLQFTSALNNMTQGLLMYDSRGRLIVSNHRFAELFGLPWEKWEKESVGKTVPETFEFAQDLTGVMQLNPENIFAEHQAILARNETGSVVFERSDGSTFSASVSLMNNGGFVVTFDDITERRITEKKINHMAHYDGLTDLPNRIYFYEKLQELLPNVADYGHFAVLSLDLDHFKAVNDTLGHPVGDKLLQAVAGRLRGCVRDGDIVARLGGDEFAILQTISGNPNEASALAARLIDAVKVHYHIEGHQIVVGTSIGIVIAPADGTEPDQLMKNVDLALYLSKSDGGSSYRFFEPQMDATLQERRALEFDLRNALPNREFTELVPLPETAG